MDVPPHPLIVSAGAAARSAATIAVMVLIPLAVVSVITYPSGGWVFLILLILVVFRAILFAVEGEVADPIGWFPLVYVIAVGGVLPYQDLFGRVPWFEHSFVLKYGLGEYSILLILGACGLIVGFAAAGRLELPVVDRLPAFGKVEVGITTVLLLLAGGVLLVWFVTTRGPGYAFGTGQFEYDTLYYVRQLAQFLFFPSLALWVAYVFVNSESVTWSSSLAAGLGVLSFILMSVIWGDRSAVLFVVTLVLIPNVMVRRRRRFGIGRLLLLLLLATVSVSAFGAWGYWRTYGTLPDTELLAVVNPVRALLTQSASVGGVIATIIDLVPSHSDYLFGASYGHAVVSLVPGFVFSGHRPFLNPSLEFHELYRPDVTGHGFGFSGVAEAYWNFGMVGVFLVMAAVAFILRATFRLAQEVRSTRMVAFYSLLAFHSMWFLRAESLSFLKNVVWSVVIILGVTFLGHTMRSIFGGRRLG